MSKYAYVTLATNDSYALGALVVANSLRRVGTIHQLAVMVTPGVTESMRTRLATVYNLVKVVNVLDSQDAANLALLSRPELGITFTKLHCWRLTQYEKCVFLDADTLVLQNCDELFDREEFSAAPDVGWPDCFNSGVFVYRPSLQTHQNLVDFAVQRGSFDGGDQGLLNLFFSDWATKDISKHLPFVYNLCSTATYSYLPAFKQFGQTTKILHFIGAVKPWNLNFNSSTKQVNAPPEYGHLLELLQLWWNIFCDNVHPGLTADMSHAHHGIPQFHSREYHGENTFEEMAFEPQPYVFRDPWEEFYEKERNDDICNEHGNEEYSQPPPIHHHESQMHQEYVQNQSEQNTQQTSNHYREEHHSQTFQQHTPRQQHEHDHQQQHHNIQLHHEIVQHNNQHYEQSTMPHRDRSPQNKQVRFGSVQITHESATQTSVPNSSVDTQPPQHQQTRLNFPNAATIQHDIATIACDSQSNSSQSDANVNLNEQDQGGLAGALAKVSLGSPTASVEHKAYEEHMRRQSWEAGQIDYMGRDAFSNIWARISQTLEASPEGSATAGAAASSTGATPKRDRTPTPQPEERRAADAKKPEGK